jgi:hypothetical protein
MLSDQAMINFPRCVPLLAGLLFVLLEPGFDDLGEAIQGRHGLVTPGRVSAVLVAKDLANRIF